MGLNEKGLFYNDERRMKEAVRCAICHYVEWILYPHEPLAYWIYE